MTGYAILLLNWTDARLDGWQPFHQSRSWLAGLPFLESGTALTTTTCLTLIRNAVLVVVLLDARRRLQPLAGSARGTPDTPDTA